MYRRILILILAAALLVMVAYKQHWYPFMQEPEELDSARSSAAINEQMQQAFDAGEGVWLIFTSATWPACVELEKLAGPVMLEYQGKVSLVKVDVNNAENQDMLRQYPIQYVPTSFFMDKQGNISFSVVGVLEPDEIRTELNKVVSD